MKVSGQGMSEPLSSTEIEDVLSSIRRLVSEDMRPLARAEPSIAAARSAAFADVGEKLILTPALRVVEAEPAQTPVDRLPPSRLHLEFSDKTSGPTAHTPSIETVVASFGAAVDATESEWEAENGDHSITLEDQASAPDWAFFDSEEFLDEIYVAENTPVAAYEGEVLQHTNEPLPGWAQSDDGLDDEPSDSASLDPDLADAAEASVIAALSAAQGHDGDGTQMSFNEDVLREVVRDVLREELAGKLGERITRNIRKLVRTEIARSLDAQDLR